MHDRSGVARLVRRMLADLNAHPREWENHSLSRYLEALAAVIEDSPGYYEKIGEPVRDMDWQALSVLLVMTTGYE